MNILRKVFFVSIIGGLLLTLSIPTAKAATFDCGVVTDVDQDECEALVFLYNSTNGDAWTNPSNWLTGTTVGSWNGITVLGGHVSAINLNSNNLTGPLPPQIGNLGWVTNLNLYSNSITGSIPVGLANMTQLKILNLNDNQLTGTIPAGIFTSPVIEDIRIGTNELTGPIPAALADALTLKIFIASYNHLSGVIPWDIGDLTLLNILWIGSNDLFGPIPTSVKDLPVTLNVNLMQSGYWTLDPEVQAYLTSVHGATWPIYQSAQGLDPLTGGNVGWGELTNTTEFRPRIRFSKFFDNTGTEAQKYLFRIFDSSGSIKYLEKEIAGTVVCPAGDATVASICEYVPTWSDFIQVLVPGDYYWKLETWSGTSWIDRDEIRFFTIAAPPVGIFPKNTISLVNPSFGWQEVAGAVSYNLVIMDSGGDSLINTTVPASACIESQCAYHPLPSLNLLPGNYSWKVRANMDGILDFTAFSSIITFTEVNAPVGLKPVGAITALNPVFSWTVTPTATSYYMYVYKNGAFLWEQTVDSTRCNVSTCNLTPTPSLSLVNGNYSWSVMAYTGTWGDYSPSNVFIKVNPPSPKFPAISTTTKNPKFIWSKVTDQTKYQVILYDSGNTVILDKTLYAPVCTTTTCSFTPSPSENLINGTYKWKVRSFNGIWGDYSSLKSFKKLDPPAPVSPSGTITATNPKFTWKKIPGATEYTIELRKSSGVLVKTMKVTKLNCDTTNCWYYSSNSALNLAAGSYKWKVRAFNGYYGPFSAYKAFIKK